MDDDLGALLLACSSARVHEQDKALGGIGGNGCGADREALVLQHICSIGLRHARDVGNDLPAP